MKFDKINEIIDIIISDEYTKIIRHIILLKMIIYHKIDFLYIVKL